VRIVDSQEAGIETGWKPSDSFLTAVVGLGFDDYGPSG